MEIARQIANYSIQREVRFILFSGEENYLYGSRYYVSKLTDNERKHIIANLNLDCIGEEGTEEGTNEAILGTSNGKENEVSQLFANYNIQIQKGPMSDYFSFEQAGIPALTIAQYPTMGENGKDFPDKISRIDKTKLKVVADIVSKVLGPATFFLFSGYYLITGGFGFDNFALVGKLITGAKTSFSLSMSDEAALHGEFPDKTGR